MYLNLRPAPASHGCSLYTDLSLSATYCTANHNNPLHCSQVSGERGGHLLYPNFFTNSRRVRWKQIRNNQLEKNGR